MNRVGSTILATTIGVGALLSGCSGEPESPAGAGSGGDYCANLPGYFQAMAGAMQGGPAGYEAWAAKAQQMAGMAPSELKGHWEFLVSYSERMKSSGGDPSKITADDAKKNGEAGGAITQHATEKCNLQAPGR